MPPALAQGSNPDVVVEAAYLVIRALRNVGRGYGRAEVSPEGSDAGSRLAASALREIAVAEGSDVRSLPPDRIRQYIEALEELSNQSYETSVGGYDSGRVEQLLGTLHQRKR
jgi:hypothetical protein